MPSLLSSPNPRLAKNKTVEPAGISKSQKITALEPGERERELEDQLDERSLLACSIAFFGPCQASKKSESSTDIRQSNLIEKPWSFLENKKF